MGQKNLIFTGHLKKDNGKLVYVNSSNAKQYEEFVKAMEEDQYVDVFFDANVDDGTLDQLAKIHKCIREAAIDTGSTFEEMKFNVKRAAGLCIKKEIDNELYMVCKSFGKCSKAELSLTIQAIIEIGNTIGIDFNQIFTKK